PESRAQLTLALGHAGAHILDESRQCRHEAPGDVVGLQRFSRRVEPAEDQDPDGRSQREVEDALGHELTPLRSLRALFFAAFSAFISVFTRDSMSAAVRLDAARRTP